jgi:hypothetical protein
MTWITYYLPLTDQAVSIQQSLYTISDGSTGFSTWPATFKLLHDLTSTTPSLISQYLLNQQKQVVWEWGSGCGLLAKCLLLLNQSLRVIASDLPRVIDRLNIDDGDDAVKRLTVREFDWSDAELIEVFNQVWIQSVDSVICVDCVYDEPSSLVRSLTLLLMAHPRIKVWLVVTRRRDDTYEMLQHQLQVVGFAVSEYPLVTDVSSIEWLPGRNIMNDDVHVFHITTQPVI